MGRSEAAAAGFPKQVQIQSLVLLDKTHIPTSGPCETLGLDEEGSTPQGGVMGEEGGGAQR